MTVNEKLQLQLDTYKKMIGRKPEILYVTVDDLREFISQYFNSRYNEPFFNFKPEFNGIPVEVYEITK